MTDKERNEMMMGKINNKPNDNLNIPKFATVQLSEAQRFILGLKEIMDKVVTPKTINYTENGFGLKTLTSLVFSDGSEVGIFRLFEETGHFDFGCKKKYGD